MDELQRRFQEFLYVLLRVAHYIRATHLRTRVELGVFDLLDRFIVHDVEGFLERTRSLTVLIQLGLSLYEIETVNGKVLLQEIDALNTAIRQSSMLHELPEIRNLGKSKFNTAILQKQENIMRQSGNVVNNSVKEAHIPEKTDPVGTDVLRSDEDSNSIASTVRQAAILDKIRLLSIKDSFGNLSGCKMRDLTSAFPQVSERTLRYDLQHLLIQGSIDRVGNGGPSLFYVIK